MNDIFIFRKQGIKKRARSGMSQGTAAIDEPPDTT
jgi:hypothetical protein